MYAIGTALLYGRTGVCRVESIGEPPFRGKDGSVYYTLRSVFSNSNERIYIPVDAPASMRPLIGRREAAGYLERLPRMKPRAFQPGRASDVAEHYRELLCSQEVEDHLLLIKEIYCKEKELSARNKKLGQVDSRYLKIAERLVCEEFAAALDIPPASMKERLYAAMEEGV